MSEPLGAEYGRYDDISEDALRAALDMGAKAVGALVIIVGADGPSNGFSVSMLDPRVQDALPHILREVARGIEAAQASKQ